MAGTRKGTGDAPRGRSGSLDTNNENTVNQKNEPAEPKIGKSGTGKGIVDESQRGRRGRDRREVAEEKSRVEILEYYTVGGNRYKTVRLLSSSTGEANIILVERDGKKYVLKLYNYDPMNPPSHEVLDKAMEIAKNYNCFIEVYSHGKWKSPDGTGPELDYELMEYCEGGALEPGSYTGDEEEFTDVLFTMLYAVEKCGEAGILHRDIKPQNFLWADKEHTRLVLADFGIACLCPAGESREVPDTWTAIYAAPEFYVRVPGRRPTVDIKSDYYSVGMSLITLIKGEQQFEEMTEPALIRMKQENLLPVPENLGPHITTIVTALVEPRVSRRWTNEMVSKYLDGDLQPDEIPEIADKEIEITFNSARGEVAHSRAELARFMLLDQTLAKKYLYSGRVARWLEEADLTEDGVAIEEIVEKIYPKDQDAGLWAALYLLDPEMPFYGPETDFSLPEEKWDSSDTQEGIAEMIDVAPQYVDHVKGKNLYDFYYDDLLKKNSRLLMYLSAHGGDAIVKEAKKLLKDKVMPGEVLNIIKYRLDPTLPYTVGGGHSVETVSALIDALIDDHGYNADLTKKSFVYWLAARDAALAGKIKKVIADGGNQWDVIYALDPNMGYNFICDPENPERVFTPADIAESINKEIFEMGTINEADPEDVALSCELMSPYQLEAYLKSKGKYDEYIEWIENCKEEWEEDEDARVSGPFDIWFAIFRCIKGMGAQPFYIIKEGEEPVRSLEDLKRYSKKELYDAFHAPNSHLDAWIATFFQEDPFIEKKNKFDYEKLLEKYIEFIDTNIGGYAPAERYHEALGIVDNASRKVKTGTIAKPLVSYVFLPIILLLLACAAAFCFCDGGIPAFNPITGHFWQTAVMISAVLIVGLFVYDIDWSFSGKVFGGFAVSVAITFGLKLLFGFLAPWLVWILLALIVLVAITAFTFTKSIRASKPVQANDEPDVKNPEYQFRELEALHYAFKDYEEPFNSTVAYYAPRHREYYNSVTKTGLVGGLYLVGVSAVLFFYTFILNPGLRGEKSFGYSAANPLIEYKGKWTGSFDEKNKAVLSIDSVTGLTVDSATLKIAGKVIALNGKCKKMDSDRMAIELYNMNPSDSMSTYYGEYLLDATKEDAGLKLTGNFIPSKPDKKGEIIPSALVFRQVTDEELEQIEKEAVKESKPKRKSASSKKTEKKSESTGQESSAAGLWKDTMGEEAPAQNSEE